MKHSAGLSYGMPAAVLVMPGAAATHERVLECPLLTRSGHQRTELRGRTGVVVSHPGYATCWPMTRRRVPREERNKTRLQAVGWA
jgi:hypothetical protein